MRAQSRSLPRARRGAILRLHGRLRRRQSSSALFLARLSEGSGALRLVKLADVRVEQLVAPVHLGEGPHWVEEDQALLFVDILKGNVHRFFIESKRHQVLHVENGGSGGSVSLVIPVEGAPDLFMVTVGRSIGVVEWKHSDPDQHTVKPVILHTVDGHCKTNRFNDGKCDPSGRMWAGTMGYEKMPGQVELHQGTLYRLDSDLSLTLCVSQVSISNGLSWSEDRRGVFYFIDTCAFSLDAFDYDSETGDIKNRRVVFHYKSSGLTNDLPDGMAMDNKGRLWIANFSGQKVVCIDPKLGRIVRQVDLPCQNITSVCWGGSHYDILYVTSAQTGLSKEELEAQPSAGAVFAVTGLETQGLPPTNFKTDLNVLRKKIETAKP
ncbi:regucalcin-like isoform X2 [Oratosquilla oratoria]|uniref:regucalcin-like isoform X2 n=1 Tax=Oratosquilla oratoria TaxID=337810 RepID=UPI003F76EA2D